jgi:hypothetical protein
MDSVALNGKALHEEMERVIACRHPHLLPLSPDEIGTAQQAGEPSLPIPAADQIAVLNLWNCGCRLLLLDEPSAALVEWVVDQLPGYRGRMVILALKERTLLLTAMVASHLRGRLDQPGLYWVHASDLRAQLQHVFLRNSLFLLRPEAISYHACSTTTLEERQALDEMVVGFIDWFVAEREAHNRRFACLRTSRPRQLRVWSFALSGPGFYIHGPMLCALGQGLLEAGLEAEILPVEPDDPALPHRLLDGLTRFCPSVFLCLNAPLEQAYRHFLNPEMAKSLPQARLVWLVDHPRFTVRCSFGERDLVWAVDGSYGHAARSMGAERVVVAPPAADLERDGVVRDELRSAVVFVGIVHDTSSFLDALAPWTRGRVEDLVERMIAGEDVIAARGFLADAPPQDLEQSRPVFEEFCRRLGRDFPDDETKILFVASVTASSRKRVQAVRALLPFRIHVYGNDAWRSVLGDASNDFFRGQALRHDLPDIYASAGISLNCHSPQLPRGLNVRDFNVLRAGGCLLSDYVADMESGILEPGRDFVVFRDTESLREAVERLLRAPDERRELAQSGHGAVLSRHLYRHRALWLKSHLEC